MFVQLPKSRWTATKKQIVSVPIFDKDIIDTMKSFPRTPTEAGIVKVQLKRKKMMKNTHLEKYISIPKIYKALNTLRRLGNKHYKSIEFDQRFNQRWRTEDPDSYDMAFEKDYGNTDDINTDDDESHDDAHNDRNEDESEDESTDFKLQDPIQKWKFNFDSVTTVLNDYPELDVRENICSYYVFPPCILSPLILFFIFFIIIFFRASSYIQHYPPLDWKC